MVLAGHALVEAYSVLTRLPPPHRLGPDLAATILRQNFIDQAEIAALDADAYSDLLIRAGMERITGGRVFDAIIAHCARAARVDAIVTFNITHFRSVVGSGIELIQP